MITRSIEQRIRKQLFGGRAIVIMGARRVGKTTLFRQLLESEDNVLWMSGDEPDVRGLFENITSTRLKAIIGNARLVVIDEAQDMSADEYRLVEALVKSNDDLRLIAVGDDDQNIFEFRGSDSSYFNHLRDIEGGRFVEMTENFRSSRRVVACANQFTHYIINRLKHKPIVAIRDVEGHVSVTRHASRFMYAPLVNDFLSHLNAGKNEGTTGILTQTNEEAVMVVGLLRKHGVRCKLVQSMEGMRFCNLAEIKYFMKCLSQNNPGPLIKDERWNNAKADMKPAAVL